VAPHRAGQANAERLRGILNETLFYGIDHACAVIREGAEDCNIRRPLSSIGYQTPASYAKAIFAMGPGKPDPIANKAPS
jgi:putative transposase